MATKKKTTSVIPDEKTISSMVSEYQELKKQEKLISERKKLIADTIKAYATEKGTKDSNGSYYSENDRFVFGSQCRKSMSFDENKAVLFFQSKGYEDCISLKPMVDESAVEVRVSRVILLPKTLRQSLWLRQLMLLMFVRKRKLLKFRNQLLPLRHRRKSLC